MLNNLNIMGRLTADPVRRVTQSGIPVTSFSIACQRDFGQKEDGTKEVDFIDCVAWRSTADFVSKYFTKGRMAVVSGRLQLRDWTDRDGNKRRSAEVVANTVNFGDSKPAAAPDAAHQAPAYQPPAYQTPAYQAPSAEDLPF